MGSWSRSKVTTTIKFKATSMGKRKYNQNGGLRRRPPFSTIIPDIINYKAIPATIVHQLITVDNINNQDELGQSALHIAIKMRRWDLLEMLLGMGADVNLCDRSRRIPLHLAIACHGTPITLLTRLISRVNINAQNKHKQTALHLAVETRRWDVVKMLVQRLPHGADVNVRDQRGETALHRAVAAAVDCRRDSPPREVLELLISPQTVSARSSAGHTPLHGAVMVQDFRRGGDIVSLLVDCRADVNIANGAGHLPLHLVGADVTINVIRQLMSHENMDIPCTDHRMTPLHMAVINSRPDVIKLLVSLGADASMCEVVDGNTPLHHAMLSLDDVNIDTDVVRRLVTSRNINMKNRSGNTPLHLAVLNQRWDLARLLLNSSHGVDVNLVNGDGELPLHIAMEMRDSPGTVVMAMVTPDNVDAVASVSGETALHLAVACDRLDLLEGLLESGASVNVANSDGETVLHLAIGCRDLDEEAIVRLISSENVTAKTTSGQSVLHLVVEERRWELVDMLIQHGAQIDAVNVEGELPLHAALLTAAVSLPLTAAHRLLSARTLDAQTGDTGQTACHLAVARRRWDLVSSLLQRGCDVTLADANKNLPLHVALMLGDAPGDIVTEMLSIAKETVNAANRDGWTPLHAAVAAKRWDLVRLLLRFGADVDVMTVTQELPLHMAIINQDAPEDIVAALISHGNINISEGFQRTPLALAVKASQWSLVPVLLQRGADIPLSRCLRPRGAIISTGQHDGRPRALKVWARDAVRSGMGPRLEDDDFASLGLPAGLMDYVKLKFDAEEFLVRCW